MFRHVLLALMANGVPMHGYALMKTLERRSGVRVSIGNIYRELQRLRAEGLIVSVENPAGADPRRVPNAITAQGRAAVAEWLSMPAHAFIRDTGDRLYFRLALLTESGADNRKFLDDLEAELTQQVRATERDRAVAGNASPVLAVLLNRRARHLAADITSLGE